MRLATYGRVVHFTREAALRDDVATFAQLLAAPRRPIESTVTYDFLTSNPVMASAADEACTAAKEGQAPAHAVTPASR